MTKEKPTTDIELSAGNLPAEIGNNALDFLVQHAKDTPYDPGFMTIKVNKGAKSFSAGAIGTLDSPLECIVLSMNRRRTLWPPNKDISPDQLAVALQCTPDEIGKYNETEVNAWRGKRPLCVSSNNNGSRGKLVKILDADAPKVVTEILGTPMEAEFKCSECRWNAFGSDFKGGAGKGCRESIMLLLYFVTEDMAATISITPTSIKAWKEYKTSFPGQVFNNVFTEISTYGITNDSGYNYNLLEFAPLKAKGGVIVPVEPEHAAKLGTVISYGGRECMMLEALIAEFLEIELEEEESEDMPEGEDVPVDETSPEF